eukprot:scaffold9688_cov60-Attheya_sp.AAC.5
MESEFVRRRKEVIFLSTEIQNVAEYSSMRTKCTRLGLLHTVRSEGNIENELSNAGSQKNDPAQELLLRVMTQLLLNLFRHDWVKFK